MADIELVYIKALLKYSKAFVNCTKGGGYFFPQAVAGQNGQLYCASNARSKNASRPTTNETGVQIGSP